MVWIGQRSQQVDALLRRHRPHHANRGVTHMNRRQEIVAWMVGVVCAMALHRGKLVHMWPWEWRWLKAVPILLICGVLLFAALRTRNVDTDQVALRAYALITIAITIIATGEVIALAMPD